MSLEVSIIMGSSSDWETMEHASTILKEFGIQHESVVYSAHRTPDELFTYMKQAQENGVKVYIAGAGLAAHLPGVIASKTLLPVLGVPMAAGALQGMDALLSIVQMPGGIPVGTLGIGKAGAKNAALLAAAMLGIENPEIRKKLQEFREKQKQNVLSSQRIS